MSKVIVIGGGASGMMAAAVSAYRGNSTILIEQNEKLGKKIYITGKGRCNLTNLAEKEEFFDNVFSGKKFSYSCIYDFDSRMLLDMLKDAGLSTVAERGKRVFPASNKASDVTKALSSLLERYNVDIRLNTKVSELIINENKMTGVKLAGGELIAADRVVVCCGGKSYPSTGSDGSGYSLLKKAGHSIIEPTPALVPFVSPDSWVGTLAGLSLKNVEATLYNKNKKTASQFGEMLFTHNGVSGPIILSLSCLVKTYDDCYITLDLKPALDWLTLEKRILRDFEEQKNKIFANSLNLILPRSLAVCVVELSGIDPEKKINQITVEERRRIVDMLKALRINISGSAGFNEAIITNGGVSTKEINPSTMESKLIEGLFMGGEVIDMHGYTGGFNLQLAFSSGHLAGMNV